MKRSRINPVSKKRREQIPLRQDLRRSQLIRKPQCEARLVDCQRKATDVHEVINRSQRSTSWLEPELFLSLCRSCHKWITEHPLWSRHHGFTLSSYQNDEASLSAAAHVRGVCGDRKCLIDHLKENS